MDLAGFPEEGTEPSHLTVELSHAESQDLCYQKQVPEVAEHGDQGFLSSLTCHLQQIRGPVSCLLMKHQA